MNTIVTSQDNTFTITGGTAAGSNLFHSFSTFSVPTAGEAFFNHSQNISNIFSRVTGGTVSNIDGLIRANGTANLFLLNPAGIIFNENARLDIGGSFLATTANQFVFNDDLTFSATDTSTTPLLSVNLAIGLQLGSNTPSLQVQGATLAVNSQQSLSLNGGPLVLTNASLEAPGGNVELSAGADNTLLPLHTSTLDLPSQRSEIQLTNSQLDVTTSLGGNITVNGGNLTLNGSSLHAGLSAGGTDSGATGGHIQINSTGTTAITNRSLIANDLQVGAVGHGGSIELNTTALSLRGGSRIQAVTHAPGASGPITINANEAIDISGFTDDGLFSGILSRSTADSRGAGGNITINAPQAALTLTNRGFIGSVTNSPSNSGTITTHLNTLVLNSGGQILSVTTNQGNAGDITINATESVTLTGESRDFVPNPFLDLTTFDLNTLEFITAFNPNVAESGPGGIPHVSVERTPTQIISGTTVLGAATNQFDYYSFSVTTGDSRVILDIDQGFTGGPGSIDTTITLFNVGTGERLAFNDDSEATAGGQGSSVVFGDFTTDSLIDTTLTEPGVYVLGVGAFPSGADNNQLLQGDSPQIGDTYTLQASIENQGTTGVSLPTDPFNPANFNPNLGARSSIALETSATGNGGNLTINTNQLILNNQGRIASETLAAGNSGDITLTVGSLIELGNNTVFASSTRGSGNSGTITLDTGRLQFHGGTLASSSFASGDTGDIAITAHESVQFTANEPMGNGGLLVRDVEDGATGNAGAIIISTPLLRLLDGAQIASGTRAGAVGNGGDLTINATDIEIIGNSGPFFSGLLVRSEGAGNGGNLTLNTERLLLGDGGNLDSLTTGTGDAGNITVHASESIEIRGLDPSGFTSGIVASGQVIGQVLEENLGSSGTILIETGQLTVAQGRILSTAAGAGNGGNITIRATDIEVSDTITPPLGPGGISVAVEPGASGQGGNLLIEAEQLRVVDGGEITGSTLGPGAGGNLVFDVGLLEVSGTSEAGNPSLITASSGTASRAGSIEITANSLLGSDGALISVTGSGLGDAGNLSVTTDQILLDRGASFQANVAAGNQGNIQLNTDFLLLQNASNITTNATGTATGGNITIDTLNLIALDNSGITANAIQGQGGNINISAQGLFLSADSGITASSELGVDGVVTINRPETNEAGVLQLPENPIDVSNQVAKACEVSPKSSFVVVGRGGLPTDPRQLLHTRLIWQDQRALVENQAHIPAPGTDAETVEGAVVETQGWYRDGKGRIHLVAQSASGPSLDAAIACVREKDDHPSKG